MPLFGRNEHPLTVASHLRASGTNDHAQPGIFFWSIRIYFHYIIDYTDTYISNLLVDR
jgi:hypothetical protein